MSLNISDVIGNIKRCKAWARMRSGNNISLQIEIYNGRVERKSAEAIHGEALKTLSGES